MRYKKILSKSSYLLLSVATALLLIFTALPYYCLTSIAFPGWNIYWGYEEIQRNMMVLFPTLSFVGAVTTLKKKNSVEDLFLNISAPLVVLIFLKVLQYHFVYSINALVIACVFAIYKVIDFVYSEYFPENVLKRIRMIYYICRKRIIYFLLFSLAPMAVYVNYQENTEGGRIFFEATAEENDKNANLETPDLVSAKQWDMLVVENRLQKMKEFADYECNKLGINPVEVFGIKQITDGTLAFYSHQEESVYFNIIYLNECSLEEALHVTSHEIYHRYEHAIIDTLIALEEAGIPYEELEYYEEAKELKSASDNYYLDSLSYSSYSQNILEIKAEEFAKNEVKFLREAGYLK